MEINSIGAMHVNDYRMGSMPGKADASDFAAILKKASVKESNPHSPASSNVDKTDELYQLCVELETFLVKNLLSSMRNTVQKSGFIDEGFAGKMYEDMLYDEYAKDFTKNAGFGLAEQAYLQLKRLHV